MSAQAGMYREFEFTKSTDFRGGGPGVYATALAHSIRRGRYYWCEGIFIGERIPRKGAIDFSPQWRETSSFLRTMTSATVVNGLDLLSEIKIDAENISRYRDTLTI